jgi:hypothetical protein
METLPAEDEYPEESPHISRSAPEPEGQRSGNRTATIIAVATAVGTVATPIVVAIINKVL